MRILGWLLAAPLVLTACRHPDPGAPVVINEVLSSGGSAWTDPDGGECPEHDDYVELFNRSDAAVALDGYTLSDDPDEPDRYVLPDVEIAANGYLLITADGDPAQGPLHAPFKVDSDGETLTLTSPSVITDTIDVPALDPDVSYGRTGDGEGTWRMQLAPSPGTANDRPPDDPCFAPKVGFDDHSVPCIATREGFFALAKERAGLAVVKADIVLFQDKVHRHPYFLDSRFFELHDEWYWFRLLNGHTFEGEDEFQPYDGDFASIPEIYEWAAATDLTALFDPFFFGWVGDGRLYSQRYYELALGTPREIGVSTLIYVPPRNDEPEHWAFELEASDDVTYDDLVGYFETLPAYLPPDVGPQLVWLVRSTVQEDLAEQMEAENLPYADRLLRYDALTVTGDVEVYRPGTVAGRVVHVKAGESGLEDTKSTDIVVLDEIPDILPACAALITAVPQTPLAHIALLAEARGIPNVYVAGIDTDPLWDSWARVHAPIALRATADGGFDVAELSSSEYATYRALIEPVVPVPATVDWSVQPWTIPPDQIPFADMPQWRPIIGGKAAGFVAMTHSDVPIPDLPLAITGRAYTEQLTHIDGIDAMLAAPEFQHPGDPRARYLVLEGHDAYDERYTEPSDAVFRDAFLVAHPTGALGEMARDRGLRGRIEDTPIDPAILAELEPAVRARFASFATTQEIRFRSSSSVEDAEGFNAAGLYYSHSGYLDPVAAGEPDATIEHAIAQVWAAYWGSEAFEERHAQLVDHKAGMMGLIVHAEFDDPDELANGVATMTRLPDVADDAWELSVNSQQGAISVTNPPVDACPEVLPEVVKIWADKVGTTRIVREQASTELPDGDVLDDAELLALFEETQRVTEGWLAIENAQLPEAQQRTTYTLDFEFRKMADGWPALADGTVTPGRLVLKQARSLEPGFAQLPADVIADPFPRDVLSRARIVTRTVCEADDVRLTADAVTTDPLVAPDLGYTDVPFVAKVTLTARTTVPELGWDPGDEAAFDWTGLDLATTVDPWTLDADVVDDGPILGFSADESTLTVDGVDGTFAAPATCTVETLWAAPDTYLDAILAGSAP
jgi:hypothetical protein